MVTSHYLSSEELVQLLVDPSGSTLSSAEPKYSYHSSAPAQIDSNLSFYHPKKNCFIQPEFSRASTKLKKTIIFSNPLLAERPLTEDERAIWNALFDLGYDVILNPAPGTSIEKCIPIKNVHDFFRLRGTAYPATVATTKKELKTQGLNPSHYITLDMMECVRVKLHYAARKSPEDPATSFSREKIPDTTDIVDLCDVSLATEDKKKSLLASIDPKTVRKVKLLVPSAEEIDFVLTHFPNLEEFIVDKATEQWLKKYSGKFENITLRLTPDCKSKVITLPRKGPKKIIVDRTSTTYNEMAFKSEPGSTTELVISGHCSPYYFVFSDIPHVTLLTTETKDQHERFKIEYAEKSIQSTVVVSQSKNIIPIAKPHKYVGIYESELDDKKIGWQTKIINEPNIVVHADIKIDTNEIFPHVKRLLLDNGMHNNTDYLTKLSAAFPNLDELILKSRKSIAEIDNSVSSQYCFPKVKLLVLSIDRVDINSNMFPNLREMIIASYMQCTVVSLGATPYLHLKKLTITSIADLKELNLALFPNLTSLTIKNCTNTNLIGDLSRLRQLYISNCPKLKDINFDTANSLQGLSIDSYQNTDNAKNLLQLNMTLPYDRNVKPREEVSFKNPNLEEIVLKSQKLKTLTANHLPKLIKIITKDTSTEHLNVDSNPKLRNISDARNHDEYSFKIMESIPTLSDAIKKVRKVEFILIQENPSMPPTALYEASGKPVVLKKLELLNKKRSLSEILDIFPAGWEPGKTSQYMSIRQGAFIRSLTGIVNYIDACHCPNLRTISGHYDAVDIKFDSPDKQPELRLVDFVSAEMKLPVLPPTCTYNIEQVSKDVQDVPAQRYSYYYLNDYKTGHKKSVKDLTKDYEKMICSDQRHQANEASPVSKFNFRVKGLAGTDLRKDEEYSARGDFTVTFHSRKAANKHKYRIEVWDRIEDDWNNNLIYSTSSDYLSNTANLVKPISKEKIIELNLWAHANDENILGVFEMSNQLGPKNIPIPTEESVDLKKTFEFYCNPPQHVKILWNDKTKQYSVHIPSGVNNLTLFYAHTRNVSYDIKPQGKLVVTSPQALLSSSLISKITANLKTNSKLTFLFDSNLSTDDKLEKLRFFCSRFNDEKDTPLTFEHDITSIVALFKRIKYQSGACYERSQAFMLLAHYIGVAVQTIGNEQHQFCEIPYTSGLKREDLGGTFRRDNTDPASRRDIVAEIVSQVEEKLQPSANKTLAKLTDNELRKKEEYSKLFKIDEKPEISLKELTDNINNNVLIQLEPSQNALSLYPKIINAIQKDKKTDYFYINSPEEFEDYFTIYYQKDGVRKQGDGPIAKIIREGGTLIVNWARFTPAQIITYQSILDTKPTLHGKSFEKPVNVIGLIRPETVSCKAFQSRCQAFAATDKFVDELKTPVAVVPQKQIQSSAVTCEVDLFSQANWLDHLVESVNYAGDKVNFVKKELLRAIATKSPLTIYNPPNDERFTTFLNRINQERRLFHNGEYIAIPPEVIIKTEKKSHDVILDKVRKRVTLVRESQLKDEKQKERIYLGLYNLHECYESLKVEKQKGYTEKKGYLDRYSETQEFYITDAIPKSSWELLMHHIDEKHPDKKFRFVLSATAYISEIDEKTYEPKQNNDSHILISNDCDYQVHQFKQANPDAVIIDVTPQMTFQDLVAKISIHRRDEKDEKIEFSYEEKGLLKALLANQSIILNGEISTRLYQQLLPLLTPDPIKKSSHIYSNGKRIEIPKGQLYVVMSPTSKERLGLAEYKEKIYKNEDYLAEKEFEKQTDNIQKILKLYEFANKIVPRVGYPASPTLSYVHLKNMLNALNQENKLHARNPIKHLFHYQYKQTDAMDTQSSEDYAYLNVIAKFIFKPQAAVVEDPAKLQKRLKKLQKITKFITNKKLDPTAYAWQLLNCLSVTDLQSLFGNNLDDVLNKAKKFPTLKPELLIKLQEKVNLLSKTQYDEKASSIDSKSAPSRSATTKRQESIDHLLKTMQLLNIKGLPGVGKSYFIEQLKMQGVSCYDGTNEDDVNKWRNDKSNKMKVLFVDEANMAQPGSWNALKPVARSDKNFFHQGEFGAEPLSDLHKVIVTGNPENYAGRHTHQFFQEYGGIIYFKMPSDFTIKETILVSIQHK